MVPRVVDVTVCDDNIVIDVYMLGVVSIVPLILADDVGLKVTEAVPVDDSLVVPE